MNTETPRTDAESLSLQIQDESATPDSVPIDFARQLETELTAVTEQRDRLAAAILKHKESVPYLPDWCDHKLWDALQSLNQPTPNRD